MFVISDKVDKGMCPGYNTLVEEKSDAVPKETSTCESAEEYKRSPESQDKRASLVRSISICIICFIAVLVFVNYVLMNRNAAIRDIMDPTKRTRMIAAATLKESQNTIESVSLANAIVTNKNKLSATDYLNSIQEVLKKRVEYSVKKIGEIIFERVQDMENQLVVFEKSVSTLVDGIVDVTKNSIVNMKSNVSKVSNVNDTLVLHDAIKRMEEENLELIKDLSEMFTHQGGEINSIIYQKAQNIIDRIRVILMTDRKLFRDVAWQHVSFCYNISRQNYEISNNLQTVYEVINKLHHAIDTVDIISSTFVASETDPQMTEAKRTLSAALNDTQQILWSMMNTDDNFLGTTLKELAYKKHIEMRDFVYKSYGTIIMSVLPAVEKVTHNFQIVRDSHWKQITKTLNPEIADLSRLIQGKVSLINDLVLRSNIVRSSKFESEHKLLETKFNEISSRVNSLFVTKQKQMIEGFTLLLVDNKNEQLPVIATWSLQNYLPSDACPISVEFQTYLKGTIDQYLNQKAPLQVVPSILDQAIELDDEFVQANENEEMENDMEDNDMELMDMTNQDNVANSTGFIGMLMDMVDTVMTGISNSGFALDGPVEIYIQDDKK